VDTIWWRTSADKNDDATCDFWFPPNRHSPQHNEDHRWNSFVDFRRPWAL